MLTRMATAPVELIKRVPLFADLDDRELRTIAASMKERTFDAGDTVTEEGKGGVGFFVIEGGSAKVSVGGKEVRTFENLMKKAGHPAQTGGFITGASAIEAIAYAIKKANGSTNGAKLASILVKLHKFPTISGKISFSPALHSVFGRSYRVIVVNDNKAKVLGQITAKSPAKIH